MKNIILVLILLVHVQRCDDEKEHDTVIDEVDVQAYNSDLSEVQKEAARQWKQFYSEAHKRLDTAEKEIARVTDRVYEHDKKTSLNLNMN